MYIYTHNTRSTDPAPAQPRTTSWARSGLAYYSRSLARRQFAPQGPALLVVIGAALALVLVAAAIVLAVRRSRAACCGCRRARTTDLASPGAGRADTKGPQVRQLRAASTEVAVSFPHHPRSALEEDGEEKPGEIPAACDDSPGWKAREKDCTDPA